MRRVCMFKNKQNETVILKRRRVGSISERDMRNEYIRTELRNAFYDFELIHIDIQPN